MTSSWAAGIAFAAVLAVPALNGCDKVTNPSTPPRPKTLDVDTADGRVTLRGGVPLPNSVSHLRRL